MKILLIDADGKIPNLALMKLYAYHKQKGDSISFRERDPELIYISIIFNWNKYIVNSLKFYYPNTKVIAGGPGFDPAIRLPQEVEQTPPDRSIYPPDGYSYGKITTGCVRKCHFCMIHVQEPDGIRYLQHPSEFWIPGTILRIFDDNILAMPKAWNDLVVFALENNVKMHIEYLDIRFLTEQYAKDLKSMVHDDSEIWFAFDFMHYRKHVENGIRLLKDAGFNGRSLRFNVYCDGENHLEDAKERWKILVDLEADPFLMINIDNITPKLKPLHRRLTRPAIYRGANIDKLFDIHTKYSDNLYS